MGDEKDETQVEMFPLDTRWFHVFRKMIANKTAARLGGTTFLIYCVVKAYANHKTGQTFPSLDTIAEFSGYNKRTCQRSIDALIEEGLVERYKRPGSKNNFYRVMEKFSFDRPLDDEHKEEIEASFQYIPMGLQRAVQDLKHVELKGVLPAGSTIQIDKMVVNLQVAQKGSEATQNNYMDDLPPTLREAMMKARREWEQANLDDDKNDKS